MYSKNTMVEVMRDMLNAYWGSDVAEKIMSAPPAVRENLVISPKENYKLVLEHKKPMYMPLASDVVSILPDVVLERAPGNKGGKDWFGVELTFAKAAGAPMVLPGSEMFTDITEWKNYVKFPDLDAIDWKKSAEEMKAFYNPDKLNSFWLMNGPFERLHSFIGIEEAFVALLEEPECCKEFFEAVADYKIKLIGKLIDNYEVDIILFHDDWGCNTNGFFRTEIFEDLLFPCMKRIVKYVKSRGVYFDMHSDGKVEQYIPHMIEMGCDCWNPGQTCNDLGMIKRKYGDKIAISGGMDEYSLGKEMTPEQIRKYVRDKIDLLGVDGGYIPKPSSMILSNTGLLNKEIAEYGATFYK